MITEQHVCPTPKIKNVFFGSSISKFTKHHIWSTTRVKKLLHTHPEDNCMWNDTDPCEVYLYNTSDSEELGISTITITSIESEDNSNATQESVPTTTTFMLEENNKTWYDTNEEYDSWHNAIETMDNYQEWIDQPMTNPIIKHIDSCIHQGNDHTNSLKSTILTPNSGWQSLHSMLHKVICFMLLCILKAKFTT